MAKSLFVSDDTHKSLMLAKMELGFRSVDDMLKEIVAEVRKARFLEASDSFTSKMREKRLSLPALQHRSETVRIELFKKWFRKSANS
jgi:hypothetical protein